MNFKIIRPSMISMFHCIFKAIDLDTNDIQSHYGKSLSWGSLGDLFASLGDNESANSNYVGSLQSLNKCLEISPAYETAIRFKGHILLAMSPVDRARIETVL